MKRSATGAAAAAPSELSVGEVAARAGVAVSTLHFWEARGLIASRRSSGNQRRYPRAVLRRVAVIKAAQALGIPLASVGEALAALPDGRPPTAADWARMSAAWRDELDRRIARLTCLRDSLTGCIGCGCLSLRVCPLRNPGDRAASTGCGAWLLERAGSGREEGAAAEPGRPPGEKRRGPATRRAAPRDSGG
ncbi:hypothetical protein STAQ_31200 [Allostella sp. ATCC 35155]|nr:hypothetical protein STAQ_31200 [Stella sp. ATCC 35155]